jgi:TatD DNase family protein
MLVDTHCHLADAAFDPDRAEIVRRAAAAGVRHIVVVADSLAATTRATGLAHAFGFSATAGVHPHVASSWDDDTAARIEAAAADPAVVAVGETGLDYHYQHSPRAVQRQVFEAQLTLAARLRKPVVVHARDADPDMADMLATLGRQVPAIVLHSFSSGPTVFAAGMEVGAYFSFSGMVTFRNWRRHDAVTSCPPDRVLVETDAPYLAPVPHRGARNEPAFTIEIASRVAALRGETLETLMMQTTENAVRCFGSRILHLETARI